MDFFDSSLLSSDDIFTMSPDNTKKNDEHITALLNSIQETENAEVLVNLIRDVLSNKFDSLSSLNGKATVVEVCLSASKKCIINIFSTIGSILNKNISNIQYENDEESLRKNLKTFLSVLELVIVNLNCVITLGPINFITIKTLPKCVAEILLEVFLHCKNSESCYASYFERIGTIITTVFKKCHELQMLSFVVLSAHVEFDLSQYEQMTVLLEVLDVIVDIGEVVMALDVKTTAEQWKGYVKICEKYSPWLKNKYIHRKATKCLCQEVQNHLNTLITETLDAKIVTRTLKISNFILKILIKLSEVFCGFLSLDMTHFIQFLATIQQYSGPHLQHLGVQASLIESITSYITIGVEPFLLNLIPDAYFRKSFTEHIQILIGNKSVTLGCLMLTATVMKLLLRADDVVRYEWTDNSENNNIICCLLNIIPSCNIELQKTLKFTGSVIENVSAYDHILIHCAALTVSCYSLEIVEKTMLTSILQENIWGNLMALDLWYIISRYGSPEYCLNQTNYFIEIFQSSHTSRMLKNTPQSILIGHHIQKLFCLLPNKFKCRLYTEYPVLKYTHLWQAIGVHNLPDEQSSTCCKDICNRTNTLLEEFLAKSCTSVPDYLELKELMTLSSSLPSELFLDDKCTPSSFPTNVGEAWKCVTLNEKMETYISTKECTVEGSEWFNEYVILLCKLTSNLSSQFTNSQWTIILENLLQIVQKSSSCIHIASLDLLESMVIVDIVNDEYKINMSTLIVKLFHFLLENKVDIIRVISMEVLSYFAMNTPNENIIHMILIENVALTKRFKNFQLKIKHDGNVDTHNAVLSSKFTHKCEYLPDVEVLKVNGSNDMEDDALFISIDCDIPVEKEQSNPMDNQISDIISRLKTDSLRLKNICDGNAALNQENRNHLVDINNVLTDILSK